MTPGAAVAAAKPSALVGRKTEIQFLQTRYEQAAKGHRQFVFVNGEAGIGKTALIDDWLARLQIEAASTRVYRGHSPEVTGESEAYQPILDALARGIRREDGEALRDQLRRSAPSWLRQLTGLLTTEEVETLQRITAGIPPERQRREFAEMLEAFSADQPVVLVIEDIHWSDASSIALLGLIAQREEAARLLVVCTCRAVDAIVNQHPARALQLSLAARGCAQLLHLGPLPADDARQLIAHHLSGAGRELSEQILQRGGGHPLFLVHLAQFLSQRGAHNAAAPLADQDVPPRLRELIELQLSQLAPSQQLLLEIGAVAGVEFAAAAVAAGSGLTVEAVEVSLESIALRQQFIAERGLVIWPDGTVSGRFYFRHALYAQVLRKRVGDSRAARLHRRLAERLETAYAGRGIEVATELAHHFEAGGVAAKAAEWCVLTAQSALDRIAPHEVREQVARGLALLMPLAADQQRHRTELRLRTIATRSLQMEHGFSTAAGHEHSDRMDELIELVGTDPSLFPAVHTLWVLRHFNLELERAVVLGERLRDVGRAVNLPSLECAGLSWMGHSLHCMGRHEEADHCATQSCRLALARANPNPVLAEALISALGIHALTRWFLGFPEQGLASAEHACEAAERLGNPHHLCVLLCSARGLLLEFTGNYPKLLTMAAEALETAHRLGHREGRRWAGILLGVAQCRTGDPETGLRTLQPVIDEMLRQGTMLQLPMGLINAARAWAALGEHDRAMQAAEQALRLIRQRGHRPFETEALRTIGELRLIAKPRAYAAAAVPIREALELARSRKALSMELRAATSLARLQCAQGKSDEALQLLEPVLARFTEGETLPDLREASALIDLLRR